MIVAGFGFRASATLGSLRSALGMVADPGAITALATADDKATAACFTALVRALNLPVHAIAAVDIAAMATFTQSPRVRQERATGSLAEAAALAAAGDGARLIAPRQISQDGKATCALAIGDEK